MKNQRLEYLLNQLEQGDEEAFILHAIAMEYMQNSPTKALQYLTRAQKKYPDYLPVYFQYASLLEASDQLEEAILILEQGLLVAKKQNDTKALVELQNVLINLRLELD